MKYIVLIVLIGSFGKVDAQYSSQSTWPKTPYDTDTIYIQNFVLKGNGMPLATTQEELYTKIGLPDSITLYDAAFGKTELKTFAPKKLTDTELLPENVGSLFYDSLYAYFETSVPYISSIDLLKHPEIELKYKDIILSSSTTLEEMKKVFPQGYIWRNYGTNNYGSYISENQMDEFTFIRLAEIEEGTTLMDFKWNWEVELDFLNKKLVHIFITKR